MEGFDSNALTGTGILRSKHFAAADPYFNVLRQVQLVLVLYARLTVTLTDLQNMGICAQPALAAFWRYGLGPKQYVLMGMDEWPIFLHDIDD